MLVTISEHDYLRCRTMYVCILKVVVVVFLHLISIQLVLTYTYLVFQRILEQVLTIYITSAKLHMYCIFALYNALIFLSFHVRQYLLRSFILLTRTDCFFVFSNVFYGLKTVKFAVKHQNFQNFHVLP